MCLDGTHETVRVEMEEEGLPTISRRGFMLGGAGLAAAVLSRPVVSMAAPRRSRKRARDLTHLFREGFPVYTGDPPARETLVTIPANGFYKQRWTFDEHSGTHMDAPGHFTVGGRLSPQITPQELFVSACVIDISARVAMNPDSVVTVDDLRDFERRHGRIPKGAGIFMYSGWESRVNDPAAYKNVGADSRFHFPGFGVDAVDWLLERRNIKCIGVDTLSLDNGPSQTFDVHKLLLGADKYGLENLANLKTIPPRGAETAVGLVPWEEGSGGPCRVIARW
jgi:kynurenine formamidase